MWRRIFDYLIGRLQGRQYRIDGFVQLPPRGRADEPLARIGTNLDGVPILAGRVPATKVADLGRTTLMFLGALTMEALLLPIMDRMAPLIGLTLLAMLCTVWTLGGECLFRGRVANSISVADLALMTGTTEIAVVTTARANAVRPRFILNGAEYYDPDDVPDTLKLLLRPSQPDDSGHLLRCPRPVEDALLVRTVWRE